MTSSENNLKAMSVIYFFVFLSIKACSGVIYQLNETEYDRMPPLYELDKYDTCLRQERGIYCWARLELFAEPLNELHSLIQEYSAHKPKHYNHSLIEKGICVTKRCKKFLKEIDLENPEDLKLALETCANNTLWDDFGLQAKIVKHFCDKHDEKTEKDIYDWIVLLIILSIVSLNVVGTCIDVIIRKQNHEKNHSHGVKYYLLCFSIPQNWNWLVSSEPSDSRLKKLKGLHGIKCFVMYLFIIGHVFYTYHGFTENPQQFEKFYEVTFYKMLFNGMVTVQVLFMISGFLLVYLLQIEAEKRAITWNMVPKIILMRIWRLTPANVVYVLFSATWLRHAGSGPVWKSFVTNRMSGDCRKYWWSHLLFINNYIPVDRYCVVQNWQLAADMQLFIFGLCVFVATKARFRILVLNTIILVGIVTMGLHIWWQDLDAYMLLTPEIYRTFDHPNYVVHKFSHVNLPGFFIGMLTGILVYELQKREVDMSKYKKVCSPLSHFIIPAMALIFYSGSIFYEDGERASLSLRLAYGMALRPVMALFMVYAIVAMVFRLSDFWCDLLEWDGWVVPSRLTYSVSLIHTYLIIYNFGSRKQLVELNTLDFSLAHLGIAALSFMSAVPYCLMVEAPFNRLIKFIASKNLNQVKKTT